jgi:hypothetical protein
MNLNAVHLEFIEKLNVYDIIGNLIVILTLILILSYINISFFKLMNKGVALIFLMITIIFFSALIETTINYFNKYKDHDVYKVYLNDDKESAKEITKEEHHFIRNVKDKYTLGEKIKEEDIIKVRDIIKR